MEFAQPPPNMAVPPPNMSQQPPNLNQGYNNKQQFRPFMNVQRPLPGPLGNMTLEDFDGKRLRKSVMRKTVDYNSSIIRALETRVWQRDYRDRRALQPDVMYYPEMLPPPSYPDNPINCVTTRFVKTATNKMRCPIFCMAWTPEGRRLVTGASSGEFTLWNGLTFNFETILQAHDSPVRTMVWSHNDSWMVTGDHAGYVKYWQSNMNNVKMFQAHKEALRGISFSPSDTKFVTCSDDGTLRIWDFLRYQEERVLRGHGADVKCVHWHPQKGLIVSGSKDNQQPIKLWDPKTGQSLATLHAHKSTVMDLKWNDNGNWLITASRDHLLKLFDLRNLAQEVQTFRGHKKEASSVAWHPVHEGLFSSGGSDGSIMFWHVGADKEVGAIEQAHDSIVWTLAWHPLGHILCSGSNDHTSKFWTRNRPGDLMRDKYNLNTLPAGIGGLEDVDVGDEPSVIPGMGPEDKVEYTSLTSDGDNTAIPGLDLDSLAASNEEKAKTKKVPFSKPIPRNFQAQWNETYEDTAGTINDVINQIVENTPGVVPLQKIAPSAIIIYGKLIPVEPGSKLESVIAEGPEALQKYIDSGEIEELHDVMPIKDDDDDEDYLNDYDSNDETTQTTGVNTNQSVYPPPPLIPSLSSATTTTNTLQDKNRFLNNSNSNSNNDSDIRQDQDLRQYQTNDQNYRNDIDFRDSRDYDMRNQYDDHPMRDEDYRQYNSHSIDQQPLPPQDYRRYDDQDDNYNDDYYDDYYDDQRNWQRNSYGMGQPFLRNPPPPPLAPNYGTLSNFRNQNSPGYNFGGSGSGGGGDYMNSNDWNYRGGNMKRNLSGSSGQRNSRNTGGSNSGNVGGNRNVRPRSGNQGSRGGRSSGGPRGRF